MGGCTGKCGSAAWVGDGNCDDDNNNCGCKYDGGDCCGVSGSKHQYSYCSVCKCLDKSFTPKPNCKGKCGVPDYTGDGRCDDENNNCACGWDSGDCCGKSGDKWQFSYCKKCLCRDPKFAKKGGCPGKKQCGVVAYVGDGRCDDNNNNCGCDWDKGDCCGTSGDKRQFLYCGKCKCLDPSFAKGSCSGKCGVVAYVGDGRCDDNNNNCGCNWDNGDCCGSSGDKRQWVYCSKCKCMDPKFKKASKCPGHKGGCEAKDWVGDGRCGDGNNNCACNWDKGDCCGTSGDKRQFSYCTKCKCLDPKMKKAGCPKISTCGAKAYKGDKRCDDENNNCSCDWDGGDCCGSSGDSRQFDYCKACKCLDPAKKKAAVVKKCSGKCKTPAWRGDKRCDDGNNNCGCGWDAGDCCGKSGDKYQYDYCTVCKCLDPSKAKKCPKDKKCGVPKYVGDKRCDDENNVCGCNWDNGDCCGKNKDKFQYSYCKACKCLDPTITAMKKCDGHCAAPLYKGDGYCDDNNNNCGCAYDGGDCCGTTAKGKNQFAHCKDCKCLDPAKSGK